MILSPDASRSHSWFASVPISHENPRDSHRRQGSIRRGRYQSGGGRPPPAPSSRCLAMTRLRLIPRKNHDASSDAVNTPNVRLIFRNSIANLEFSSRPTSARTPSDPRTAPNENNTATASVTRPRIPVMISNARMIPSLPAVINRFLRVAWLRVRVVVVSRRTVSSVRRWFDRDTSNS